MLNSSSRHFASAVSCIFVAAFAFFSTPSKASDFDDTRGNSTEEEIKAEIASLQGNPIPKTDFEIQTDITETKQSKAKAEQSAREFRRNAKAMKETFTKPENQAAKRKADFKAARLALLEKLKSNSPIDSTDVAALRSPFMVNFPFSSIENLEPDAAEDRPALDAISALQDELLRIARLRESPKASDYQKLIDKLLPDSKTSLYEMAIDIFLRQFAERAASAEKMALSMENLAKAGADRLNKLSEALAGQVKNQARVVNALVEKLPVILGILCGLFAVNNLTCKTFSGVTPRRVGRLRTGDSTPYCRHITANYTMPCCYRYLEGEYYWHSFRRHRRLRIIARRRPSGSAGSCKRPA